MALPITIPYTFGTATAAIPLSNLDSDYQTVYYAVNGIGNGTVALANVQVTGVGTTFPNNYLANSSVTIGNTAVALGSTAATVGNVTLANVTISSVSAPLTVAQGGTGLTTITANGLMAGNGTSNVTIISAGTSGNVLTSNGTAWLSTAPSAFSYPGAGIVYSTGSAWGTSYTTSGSGTVLALNNTPTLTNPTVTNYVETLYSANTSTAITVALTNGTVQLLTLTGNATITMPTAVAGKSFIIMLKQDATGSRTVTWSTVVWGGGTAPTITSTASKQDIYSFFSDGTNWYGATIGQNY